MLNFIKIAGVWSLPLFIIILLIYQPSYSGEYTQIITSQLTDNSPPIPQEKPIYSVVIFGAKWCAPCRALHKNLEEESIKKLLKRDDLEVYDIDIDENPQITQQYNVGSVPHIFIMRRSNVTSKNNNTLSDKVGLQSVKGLEEWLTKYLP
jgi:thioredoxin-like negative regulator of GroEL